MKANEEYRFLANGGELGELTLAYDWSSTPVGEIKSWPQSLRSAVGTLLHSGFPMLLWWGDDMIQFYNDAYRASLGQKGKHPTALGQSGKECWLETWHIIYPLIDKVKSTGKSFFLEDQLVPIYRDGSLQEVYWTYSYSAVFDELGRIAGVLVVCHETTKTVANIRELEKIQSGLLRSESNLRNIFRQAPVAMAILKGPDHIVEIANDRMLKLWGKPKGVMVGKPIFDELIEAKHEGFEDLLNNVLRTGETYSAYGAPVTLYRNGGTETVYVHFVYEAFREEDDRITGVMAVAVDVTEEVMARKKLEQSENKIRSLVESAPFPIGVYEGKEMRITMANQAIMEVWGRGDDVVGKTYHQVLPELKGQNIYEQLDRVYMSGVPVHKRNERVDLFINGQLRTFYFNYSFTPLFSDGQVYGVMNTAADVTDLNVAKLQVERSERNFKNMVKQAPVAMCIMTGPDHVVEVANDLMIQLWGKSESEVMNRPIFSGLPDARGQGLESILGRVYEKGEVFTANERPVILLRNGKYDTVYQNFVYEPYRDPDGTILGVLAITIDVTEQVVARLKIEDVVKERTESLRKSNAELSQFAYIASHDLQEPARKIRVFVEMLERSLGNSINAKANTYLTKIDNASARMLRLIRDVLTISQLSKSQQEFVKTDLNVILEEVRNDYELVIDQKQCRLESDRLPLIMGIPIQMSQLFANLVSNALKFSKPDKEQCLTIKHSLLSVEDVTEFPVKQAARYSKIEFQDNGIGFSQDNATQIFDIFQRLHGKSEYEGTGLGLAICKKIVENHGGHIFAESSIGAGATFTVILPHDHQ